jgi:ATP-binding cassette subfamily C (CFTR/MRP) protein 10
VVRVRHLQQQQQPQTKASRVADFQFEHFFEIYLQRADMDLFLSRFTNVLEVGFQRVLLLSDLPPLPAALRSAATQTDLLGAARAVHAADSARQRCKFLNKPLWVLVRVLLSAYGGEFLFLGLLKLMTCLLSFVGPVLLNQIVTLVEDSPDDALYRGLALVGVLFAGLALQSVVGAQYNIYAMLLQTKIRGALTLAVFSRAVSLPQHALRAAAITEGEISNMVQIDVSKIADVVPSLHDLWNLPLLLLIAFTLLYFQVKIGFLAGVAIIVVMIPINSKVAAEIGRATAQLMVHKDARVSYISDAIRGMKSIKMLGLESIVYASSLDERDKEMKYLSIRKYLVRQLTSN